MPGNTIRDKRNLAKGSNDIRPARDRVAVEVVEEKPKKSKKADKED